MSKQTNENRKETSTSEQKQAVPTFSDPTPQMVYCKRCKTRLQEGVCPTCGFKAYVPMDKEKREKIKLILTIVGMAIFLAIFIYMRIQNS